ncbi:MAG: hypothetical protein ABI183_02375, partial [Polyangiaceae bacterium]
AFAPAEELAFSRLLLRLLLRLFQCLLLVAHFLEIPRRWSVAPGRCLPGAPTDPDVQNSRIPLFETQLRYAGRAALGASSG